MGSKNLKHSVYIVKPWRGGHAWAVHREGAARCDSLHATQHEALARALEYALRHEGTVRLLDELGNEEQPPGESPAAT